MFGCVLYACGVLCEFIQKAAVFFQKDNGEVKEQTNHFVTTDNKNQTNPNKLIKDDNADQDCDDGFEQLICTAIKALVQSDIKCGDRTEYGSSSQGRWLYDPAVKNMRCILDRLVVCLCC